jgi:glycosyltransferase involved in cell wall biosynthesis
MEPEMRIIVYSETTADSVGGNLGQPEYSYYFILKKYLPSLTRLGEVCHVEQPASEVDPLFEAASKAGVPSVFLSFTPPHRTAKGLKCPTVCVLAWEFDNIPSDDWDPEEPWQNWVKAIREIGNVITISDYATRVIKRQVGKGAKVVTIPAPVDPVAPGSADNGSVIDRPSPVAAGSPRSLSLTAAVFDTECLDIDTESVTPKLSAPDAAGHRQGAWDGRAVDWGFSSKAKTSGQYLVGFYGEEDWGSWSKTARPSVIFPWSLSGPVEVSIETVGYGTNQGRTICVHMGNETAELVLQSELHTHTLRFAPAEAVNNLYFTGLSAVPEPGARDHRTLGLGLSRVSMRRPGGEEGNAARGVGEATATAAQTVTTALSFSGVVYTSVFNPADGRKNWLDIVTAFVWAFRNQPDRSLVLKMSHHNRSTFLGDLFLLFARLAPFQCRVVAIHGYLSAQELHNLVGVTDYFVNASVAEGQCLPLLEFMAEGVPAVSPDHTAMASYIKPENAFVVQSSHQPHIWPNDPRECYRTLSNRIDWDSLRRGFVDSAAVVVAEPERYQAMSRTASATVAQLYSSAEILKRLQKFLGATAKRRRWRFLRRG